MKEKNKNQMSIKDNSVRNSRANLFAYVFSEEEADKTLTVDLGDIRITAKVVDIRFDSLAKEAAENPQDALAGYSYFSKVFEDMKNQGKSPYEAYCIAVEESIEKDYLANIWNRKECVDMFAETYCYDALLKEEDREEGKEEGLELSTLIFNELRKNVPISEIVKKYGVAATQIEKMKEAIFAI